jgi:hypothetical protein
MEVHLGKKAQHVQYPEFYKAKIKVADFYFERLLPRTQGHAEAMVNPSKTMTSLAPEHFSFDY